MIMEPRGEFSYFRKLPAELRIEVWRHHFMNKPRVHGIISSLVPTHGVTTRRVSLQVRTIGPNSEDTLIDSEAHAVVSGVSSSYGKSAKLAIFGWLPTVRVIREPLLRGRLACGRGNGETFGRLERTTYRYATIPGADKPLRVSWKADLVYIAPMYHGNPFMVLEESDWARHVRHLAFHPRMANTDSDPSYLGEMFHPQNLLNMHGLEELEEVLLVVQPLKGTEAVWKKMKRDEFGFVNFNALEDWGMTELVDTRAIEKGDYRVFLEWLRLLLQIAETWRWTLCVMTVVNVKRLR
ncbi:hypothetical protein F5Y15DRAFT_364305 [Xylariaceae sp. FL0016]|nr:hypothetical protein F5Y15DRAFT_364305 [Xylariaceae sp. FL0016]